jgi:ribosome biogenesis protein BRX1
MNDLIALMPHSKKESKLDTKTDRGVLNEVADLKVLTCIQPALQAHQLSAMWDH